MIVTSRAALADVFGWSMSTVDRRLKEGIPYVEKPEGTGEKWKFDTAAVHNWVLAQEGGAEKVDALKDANLRDKVAEAGIKEMKLDEMRGELVYIDDILEHVEAAASIVKSRMNAIPGRLSQTLAVEDDPAAIQRVLKAEIGAALGELNEVLSGLN